MIREFDKLGAEPFDLLVIGGGIYGAWVAYDAALRDLRVALVERSDWAAGTSSASSKLIHGGLRYLEQYRFGLVRKTSRERELLLRLAPHAVRPLRFVFPLYRHGRVGRRRLGLGLWAYDRLAGTRRVSERHAFVSRDDLRATHPFLERQGLTGGFTFFDSRMDDSRIVLELVDGAFGAGAVVANRARAVELLEKGGQVRGARVEDGESGRTTEVRASMVANCAGAWAPALTRTADGAGRLPVRLSRGTHLVMPGLPSSDGLILPSRAHGGIVFLIPWYGRTLVGTTDTGHDGDPDRVAADPADVAYLLEQANRALEGDPWTESEILGCFWGLRTLPRTKGRSTSAVSRELLVNEPLRNLIVPVGGKYSSARADAAGIVDRVCDRLSRGAFGRPTEREPFPWAPRKPLRAWSAETLARGLELGLDEETVTAWQWRYGSRISHLFGRLAEQPGLAARIDPGLSFREAELVHAVEHEMARGLEDVLRRRLPLLILTRLSRETLERAARRVGAELDWSDARRDAEIAAAQPAVIAS